MPVALFVSSLIFFGAKPAWNQIVGHSIGEVEGRLGKPVTTQNENYANYDPRWIKWIVERPHGLPVEHTLEIVWRYEDHMVHDLDLWANRRPANPGGAGNWVSYLGGPVSEFEKLVGKPTSREVFTDFGVRNENRVYKTKAWGDVQASVFYFNPKSPVLTKVTIHFGPKAELNPTLASLKVNAKSWRQMDRDVDPNSDAHLRFYLGEGRFSVREYSLPNGEKVEVQYAGPKGNEIAQSFAYFSDRLTGLLDGAAMFGYTIAPSVINKMQGSESAWDRPSYFAVYSPTPQKQIRIGIRNFDPSDLPQGN